MKYSFLFNKNKINRNKKRLFKLFKCLFIEFNKFENRKIFLNGYIFSLLNKKENNDLVEEDKENLQKAVLDKLPKLSELSIYKTMKIVDNWFSNENEYYKKN